MINMVKLSDVSKLTVGYVGSMEKEYTENGIKFLRSLNVKPFSFDLSDVRYITKEFNNKISKSILHTNDVVIVRTGIPGTAAVVPEELDGCNCSDLVIVRPDTLKINPHFLCAFINSWGASQIKNVKVGAVQKHFNVSSAQEMLVPFPKLEEQNMIADIIYNLNSKIALNNSICSDLESMAKLLYDYWFVQFDFPDENGRPYKSSGGKMVWNDELKREIPEGWNVFDLPKVADVKYGYPLSTALFGDSGKPVIRIRDILDLSNSAYTKEKIDSSYLSKIMDLLIGMDGNFQMNFWNKDGDIINQRIVRIRETTLPNMIVKYQIEPIIQSKVKSVARSTVGHLSDADIKGLKIIVPKNINMSCFNDYLAKVCQLKTENQEITSLLDFLLPMLMNGQIKIEKHNRKIVIKNISE